LAVPIFSFYLPLYSFWHFDDFSWGKTHRVVGEGGGRRSGEAYDEDIPDDKNHTIDKDTVKIVAEQEAVFDASLIPLTPLADTTAKRESMIQIPEMTFHQNRWSFNSGYF
jgi:Chitin synthase